jgi:hypothetical protein
LRRRLAAVRLTVMRGDERDQDGMFSYVSLELRVPQDHPLRAVRKLTDAVLRTLSPEFDALYADMFQCLFFTGAKIAGHSSSIRTGRMSRLRRCSRG